MDDILRSQFDEARTKLASLRPLYYHRIATDLGLPKCAAGTICDIINGRYDHVSEARLKDIRIRLGLARKRAPYRRPTWAMVRAMQAEIDDWHASMQAALDPCADEQHCACVPYLRRRIAELEAQLEALHDSHP